MKTGIILLIIGFALNYTINRRRFNRRSITGVELFRSYEQALFIRGIEGVIVLIARVLITSGSLYTAFRISDF